MRTHWCCIRKGENIKRDKIILDGLVNHFLAVCVGRWIPYFWILHLWDGGTQWGAVMASATFLALCRHIILGWGHVLVSYRWMSQILKKCCYILYISFYCYYEARSYFCFGCVLMQHEEKKMKCLKMYQHFIPYDVTLISCHKLTISGYHFLES